MTTHADGPPRDLVYRCVVRVVRAVFVLLGLRFTVTGSEHVPTTGAAVLAFNHTGYLDFTYGGLAAAGSRRLVRFMAKQATFDSPVSGPAMRAMRHIPVDRTFGAPAYRKAIRALQAGQVVGVFPEATISRAFMLKDFKRGAAGLALREGVPLIPVVMWGGHRVLTVDGRHTLQRGIDVSIEVGEPIEISPYATVETVTADLRARMAAMLDRLQRDYPQAPGEPVWWQPRHLGGTAPTAQDAAGLDAARIR